MTTQKALNRVKAKLYTHVRRAKKFAAEARTPGSAGLYLAFASDYEHAIRVVNEVAKESRSR